ncbi:unnamed protein product [Bracoviriform congregatae]|uniref:Maverick ATPase p31.3 protein n=2 Tax=root TaxID=1 RepID=Q5ZNU9_9VIRU|nr:unnamed protein product [Bracoviriform congregatae]CAG18160.1 unnamed protein product [Bracoviriform congregatae]CBZ06033.1 Maverick ATPase p31.3 [Bracoviriform congregatae]CCQ71134.1 hypothetical Maverick ATPase protein p31.3 [Cotesia congregata]
MDNKLRAQLPVINFDQIVQGTGVKLKRHGALLPNSIHAVFCGPSNCGKTNALLSLIVHPNGLRFENIYLYSKSLNQPKYQFLETLLKQIDGIGFFTFSEHEAVIKPEDAKPNSLMIFDDVACEKQDHIKAFFCMGRHKDVDSFYLCQTYTRIPKHLIRDNANFLVLFRQDEMNLKHIYDDHVNTDMPYNSFRDLCSACWNKYGFVVIDKDSELKSEEKPQVEKEEVQEQEIEKSLYADPEEYNSLISNDESSLNNTSFAVTQPPPSTSTPARKNPPLINYLQRLSKKHKDNDMRYGIRRKHGELHMGDSPISFANDTISIKGKNYPITPGLLELLFRKSPDDALITPDDKDKYLDIIQHTNTHRKNYDPNRSIYEDITIKYNKYVADFLTKFGKGLPKHMIARKQRLPMDYVYWDDPNELVDRLRLLMASQAAGNPSHTNEIMSIIEELREAGVIY